MAIALKELGLLTIKEQESILEGMMTSYDPIEVDGKVFMIPREVNNLIDDLFLEVTNLRNIREEDIGEGNN
tara:strand:- start:1020 stop:1232 length:213 start_codon:yes stop_codon:yes gene_type:complete